MKVTCYCFCIRIRCCSPLVLFAHNPFLQKRLLFLFIFRKNFFTISFVRCFLREREELLARLFARGRKRCLRGWLIDCCKATQSKGFYFYLLLIHESFVYQYFVQNIVMKLSQRIVYRLRNSRCASNRVKYGYNAKNCLEIFS